MPTLRLQALDIDLYKRFLLKNYYYVVKTCLVGVSITRAISLQFGDVLVYVTLLIVQSGCYIFYRRTLALHVPDELPKLIRTTKTHLTIGSDVLDDAVHLMKITITDLCLVGRYILRLVPSVFFMQIRTKNEIAVWRLPNVR